MRLEKKIAYFVDLGEMPFIDVYNMQETLKENPKAPDVIFTAAHTPEVSFGAEEEKNAFDPDFAEEMVDTYGEINETIVKNHLADLGITFTRNGLGGGATSFAPGQVPYYFIIDVDHMVNGPNHVPVGEMRVLHNDLMIRTAEHFISDGVDNTNIGKYKLEVDNKADVFVKGRDDMTKIASKGISFSKAGGRQMCISGINYFVDSGSVDHFRYVLPCGLNKDKTKIATWEDLVGSGISRSDVHDVTLGLFKEIFGFDSVERISYEEFEKRFL